MDDALEKILHKHPCYSGQAHLEYARMHLPVAPKCNIQCNYCNGKYDCTNESRPGVTSEVLTPEQAVEKVAFVKKRVPNLSVIGIAGPGDPLANKETFRTLELIKKKFPETTLCISTNGLALPGSAQHLYNSGVRFVTVTINAPDADTGAEIYASVLWNGEKLTGREGAELLLKHQLSGIRKCASLGMLVKANIVMIPDINTDSIPTLVKKVRELGAYIVNILPLIPVPGTKFGDLHGPTPAERRALMDECSLDARMMRHCRQCRADAIGLLGEDRSSEFTGCGYGKGNGRGPSKDVPNMVAFDIGKKYTIAIASTSGSTVDSGFGSAERFLVYRVDGPEMEMVREVYPGGFDSSAVGKSHKDHIAAIAGLLSDCDIIAVEEIGDMPRSVLEEHGKKIMITSEKIRKTVIDAGSAWL